MISKTCLEIEDVNTEHEAQVRDLLQTQMFEKEALKTEFAQDFEKLRLTHSQQIESIKEAHKFEIEEVQKGVGRETSSQNNREETFQNDLNNESKIRQFEMDLKGLPMNQCNYFIIKQHYHYGR